MTDILRANPYRVFFPLGILFALAGVGEWVFWSIGWTVPAASLLHASLQAQGFLASFAVGFLMTAFPRFTGTSPAEVAEIGAAFLFAVGLFISLLARSFHLAQFLFLGLLLTTLVFGARRLPGRTKPLPPSFLLMGFGFLHAIGGTALVWGSGLGERSIDAFSIGRQMVQVGFLLCLVLGITAQLAPFLMGYTGEPGCEEGSSSAVPRTGPGAMAVHAATGAVLLASFILIPWAERASHLMRAAAATFHLLVYARIARPVLKKTALIYFFTLSMWMIPAGLWLAVLAPVYRIAALHLVFIGGFSLMIFSFGQLVVLSHSRHAQLLNGRLIPLKIVGGSVVAAALMRVSADFFPGGYMLLIHFSSGLWVLAAAFWLINLWPKMFGASGHQH